MPILSDPLQEARRIIDLAAEQGLTLRLLGGLAIRLHSPSAAHPALVREVPDLDFILGERRGDRLESILVDRGYAPNKPFNLLNGDRRLLFFDELHGRQVDIFVGVFRMCHTITIKDRLTVEPLTVPLAELLLSKLQIFQLNEKDLRDLSALLLDHPFGASDEEMFHLPRIAQLCGEDWGLWKTVSLSLDTLEQVSQGFELIPDQRRTLAARIDELRRALQEAPKSMRWKVRAKIGERLPWYELPEEVRRG